jgi:hypothetical protein
MDELDRRIAEALAEDDLGLPEDAREPGFFTLAFSTMRGPQGWVTCVILIMQTAMFLVAIWAGWNFFTATEELSAIKWGVSAATLMILTTQLKLALFPHMQANRVIFALRRLELRLAAKK